MRHLMARIAGRAVERPTPVIVAAVLLALIGAVAALRLEADRSPSSLVDKGSTTQKQSQATLAKARQVAQQAVARARRQSFSPAETQQAGVSAGNQVLQQFQQQLLSLAVKYGQQGLPQVTNKQFVTSVICDPSMPL